MLRTIVTAITLAVSLLDAQSTEAQEGSFLVSCPTCAAAGNPSNPIYFLPAFGENEPGVESAMQINFPGFTYSEWSMNGGPRMLRPDGFNGGYFQVLDNPNGLCSNEGLVSCSDVVLLFPNDIPFDNRILIASDPDVGFPPQFVNLGTLAIEGDFGATGATLDLFGLSAGGTTDVDLRFTFGFDAEFVYDPFGVGVDTSDDVQLSSIPEGAFMFLSGPGSPPFTNPRVPEPSSLAVLATAPAALGCLLYRGGGMA